MGDNFNNKLKLNMNVRIDVPIWLLICLECYSVWQLGIIFFSGNSFSILGHTPLPIAVANTTLVSAWGGIVAIVIVIFFQRYAAQIIRIGVPIALAWAIILFFPIPENMQLTAIYIQGFMCIALFGCCHSLIVLLFSEEAALRQAVVTVLFVSPFIAVLQNQVFAISFEVFNTVSIVCLSLFVFATLKLPSYIPVVFTDKQERIHAPVMLIVGLFFWVFAATLVMEMALTTAEGVNNGVSYFYIAAIAGGIVFLFMWKKCKAQPLKLFPIFLAISCIGFVFATVSIGMESFRILACLLTGFGLIIFTMVAYIGQWVFRLYPSRYLMPGFMTMILLAIMAHSVLLETLRGNHIVLYAVYGVFAAVLLVSYLLIEPYLNHRRQITILSMADAESAALDDSGATASVDEQPAMFKVLTSREREVAELLLQGYTGSGIAKQLYVSENTVSSHRKEIYRKLDIHSKRELFEIASKQNTPLQ